MADYKPDPHYLRSLHVENLGWHDALAELIDNAFDADANRIEITVAKKQLLVSDDGVGCDDLTKLVRLGSHGSRNSTRLGMHGRGVKDAWMWLGDSMQVDSIHKGSRYTLSIKATELIASDWVGPDQSETAADGAKSGTTLVFDPLDSKRTAPKMESVERLQRTFMPALKDGRQVILRLSGRKAQRLKPADLPIIEDVISESFEIEGHGVSISIGIVPAGTANPDPGFVVIYGHRVVCTTTLGCGEYSVARMSGTITLDKTWKGKIAPHKDNISAYREELDQEIQSRIILILQKAHSQSMNAETQAMVDELSRLLKEGIAGLKGQRDPPRNNSGTIKPTGRGGKHRNLQKTQRGDGSGKPRRGIQVDFYDAGRDDVLGKCEDKRVVLNSTHPAIGSSQKSNNILALYSIAFGLYCHHRCNNDGDKQGTLFERHDFNSAWGIALKTGRWQGGLRDEEVA